MDELSEEEEMELERNLHQLRHTRQQVEKRAKHATVQAKYRAKLALNRAPTRMDFAIVTLGVVLRAIEKNSEHGFVRLLREAIEDELRVLAVDNAVRTDGAREELRRVAAGGAEVECDDTWTDADKAEHLLGLAAQIVRPVRRGAIGA